MQNTRTARLTEGPLFGRIFLFSIPLMLSGILQLLYNAADNIVVGRFSGDPHALAAVGSTSSLNNLIVNFLIGFSVGSSVVIAQYYGAKKEHELSRSVHTSIAIAFIGGIIIAAVGFFVCKPALLFMGTKPELLDKALLYTRIICLGIPGSAVYNFGATVLRAAGDSKTPLFILAFTGIFNVVFNFVFVLGFNMSVAGVAIATIISQYLSAIAVIMILRKSKESYGFRFKNLCIDLSALKKILIIGIPAGLQSTLFSLSNVIIQSAVNTFPLEAISGNTIGSTIEGFTYIAMNSFSQAAVTFTGQNYGAGKYDRVKKSLIYSLVQVTAVGIIIGYAEILLAAPISAIFVDPTQGDINLVIDAAVLRSRIILSFYFLCGIMEVLSGYLRGLGHSVITMVCSLGGACLFRILWVKFIFVLPDFNSPSGLYISYPISWAFTCAILCIFCVAFSVKLKKAAHNT